VSIQPSERFTSQTRGSRRPQKGGVGKNKRTHGDANMTICDKCPCHNESDDNDWCNLSDMSLIYDYELRHHVPQNNDCPLKQIELKDGTVFRPEVAE